MEQIEDLELMYKRIERLIKKMQEENVDVVVFRDSEDFRNPAVRYFSRIPQDAILAIGQDGQSLMAVWDVNLANEIGAFTEKVFSFSQFGNDPITITSSLLKKMGVKENSRIEINPSTPYPEFLEYVDRLQQYDILCRKNGVHDFVTKMRARKDKLEIASIKKACAITNSIIARLEEQIVKGKIKTELDAALEVEILCRSYGCERTSFETLAAGPKRSFAIHAFPNYTNEPFATDGLSLIDFGLYFEGYASDVTLTIAKGKLSEKQEKMIELVQKAANQCVELYKAGLPIRQAALKADRIFSSAKMKMPHSLGHGMGLEIHEEPFIKSKAPLDQVFEEGMVCSLEPGLYDIEEGGVRLENDVLILEEGNLVLTRSKIIRIE